MSWVQFFQRSGNTDDYLNSILSWIWLIKPFNIIQNKYLDLLLDKVRKDTESGNLISRDDLLNFGLNCEIISQNEKIIPSLITKINKVENSDRSDIEKVYEIVTVLDEFVKEFKSTQEKEKLAQENLEKLNMLKQQEEQEKQKRLDELDNLLNQL